VVSGFILARERAKRAKPILRFARLHCFGGVGYSGTLFRVSATLLPVPLAGKCCLDPLLFTWLQVKGMALDFFNDVFGLHFALETAQRVLERFPFLQSDFSQ
jgi:hypothetical protein